MSQYHIDLQKTQFENGEMKRFDFEGTPVIVARISDDYYAFRATCTHYGGPLDEGLLKGYTVMCPWHHACFDIRSGLRTEPPALNDLPTYSLQLEGQLAIITIPDSTQQTAKKANTDDNRHFIIIGGGAAGNATAEELRRRNFAGKITLISASSQIPIDRPNLSKDYLDGHAKPEWMPLRNANWYHEHDIALLLNHRITAIDPVNQNITLSNHSKMSYDKLLLATGGIPRQLDVPGVDFEHVFTLRSMSDADAIISLAQEGKRVVVIGASFIGMEVAASLASGYNMPVTVVAPEKIPFARIFGDKIGHLLHEEHENNNIHFRLQSEVNAIHSDSVELKNGEHLPADMIIVGIGVEPATNFLRSSGLDLDQRDDSVMVNSLLQSSNSHIYAAGDIARWDNGTSEGLRIEHWRVAQQQGMIVARNMLGENENINKYVPFFWTKQWNLNLMYVGHAPHWDEIIYRGNVIDKDFTALYIMDDKLVAAVSCNRDQECAAIEFIIKGEKPLSIEQMRDPDFDLVRYAIH